MLKLGSVTSALGPPSGADCPHAQAQLTETSQNSCVPQTRETPVKHNKQIKLESGTISPKQFLTQFLLCGWRRTNVTTTVPFGNDCNVILTIQTPISGRRVLSYKQQKSQLWGGINRKRCIRLTFLEVQRRGSRAGVVATQCCSFPSSTISCSAFSSCLSLRGCWQKLTGSQTHLGPQVHIQSET